MSIQDVPTPYFTRANVRPVCGFIFRYDADQPEYGVMVVTDGTMPQIKNVEAAAKVGQALQWEIFGKPAENKTPTYYKADGFPDNSNLSD